MKTYYIQIDEIIEYLGKFNSFADAVKCAKLFNLKNFIIN